jgi:hypothetical protein
MQAKARENPVHRLPDWRTTLPLAQSCPRYGAKNPEREFVPIARNEELPVPDARRKQHRANGGRK